jgi:hypothetical protein
MRSQFQAYHDAGGVDALAIGIVGSNARISFANERSSHVNEAAVELEFDNVVPVSAATPLVVLYCNQHRVVNASLSLSLSLSLSHLTKQT